MKTTLTRCQIISLAVLTAAPAFGGNWPNWRGPEGNGVSPDKNLPLKWSATENVRWRAALPSPGNSSPIVWGDRVFVTQAVSSENRRTVMCFDRATGKLLWQSGVTYTEREQTQQNNPYCAGTPATDGERVYACFNSAGVYAYDFDGKEVWHRDLGKLNHGFGTAVSPVLHGDLCLVNFGPGENVRLVALHKKTGEIAWQVEPPKVDPSEQEPMRGGFGGPRGFGGPGGRGGRGGFGPGVLLGSEMLSQADKNSDQKLTKEEFTALADAWFNKVDPDNTGKANQDQFTERFSGGFGPARGVAPGLFTAADANKDGSLTRDELKLTFAKWFADWDSDKRGSLNEDKLRDGLNAALPRPNFGGPGGPGGPGGGRGPGGPGGPGGRGDPGGGLGGSWSTPILVKTDGRDELIVNFPNRLAAYDPKTGQQLWLSKGLGGTIYTTPLAGEGVLVAMSSGMGGGNALALKPGGSGDVTESHRVWRSERAKSGMGSGVIHDGHLYTISQEGIAVCLDLNNGQTVWEERLKGPGVRGSSWSSMLLADGKIYVPNQSGDVFVLRASPKFEVLATNSVSEPTNASLAASGGELFLRTDKSLWCFATAKPD